MSVGNSVVLSGNLTRDFELRYTQSGLPVASSGLAVNRRWKSGDEWKEDTSFIDLTVWDKLAENAAESLHKGTNVIVEGRIRQENWESKEGDKRSKLTVTVENIGPSLRWATADVEKNEREGGGSSSGGGKAPEPASDFDWGSDDESPF